MLYERIGRPDPRTRIIAMWTCVAGGVLAALGTILTIHTWGDPAAMGTSGAIIFAGMVAILIGLRTGFYRLDLSIDPARGVVETRYSVGALRFHREQPLEAFSGICLRRRGRRVAVLLRTVRGRNVLLSLRPTAQEAAIDAASRRKPEPPIERDYLWMIRQEAAALAAATGWPIDDALPVSPTDFRHDAEPRQ